MKKLKKSNAELTPWEKAQKKRKQAKKHHRPTTARSFVKKLPRTNSLRKQRLAKGTIALIAVLELRLQYRYFSFFRLAESFHFK